MAIFLSIIRIHLYSGGEKETHNFVQQVFKSMKKDGSSAFSTKMRQVAVVIVDFEIDLGDLKVFCYLL